MMLLQYQYLGGIGSEQTVNPDLGFATVIGWVIFVVLVVVAAASSRWIGRSPAGGR
jgi:hypothetical protein